jgi:GGDEF domain-containing protein
MTRRPRRRRCQALLRGRFRSLFFALLTVATLAMGDKAALVPALLGVAAGMYSIRVACTRGEDLAHTFGVVDWLVLGCVLIFAGGANSWLLAAIPLLAMGQLAGSQPREWPYLMTPALLLLIVLAIADPSLGGSRPAGVAKVLLLAVGGWVAATRLRRRPALLRRPARVDVSTGLGTSECLRDVLAGGTQAALREHSPLSVVHLRLEHFEDCRNFLGPLGSEKIVRGVAHHAERLLGPDDRAFRVARDTLVLVLPGSTMAQARALAAAVAHDVSASLIAGRRQTLATGASSFPTIRRIDDLLAAARSESLAPEMPAAAPAEGVALSAAR